MRTANEQAKQALAVVAVLFVVSYLLSGRRWSDEGRLRRWLKGR